MQQVLSVETARMGENLFGRGQPHPEDLVHAHLKRRGVETPPAMYTVKKIQECFFYVVSLEFILGDMDSLKHSNGETSRRYAKAR